MNTSKIIKGVVSNGRYTVTAPIIKEDYGLYLQIEGVELPSTYEVDFSNSENSGSSVTMIGNADGVLIPRQFISTGKDVFAFLYHVGEDFGRTVYKFRIPNKVRPDRTNEEPTPEEQSVIDQAISALNEAVAQTAGDVESADQSARSAQGYAEQAETAKTNAQTYANNASASATSASQSAQASANSATASANSASASAQIKADVEELVDDAQASADASERSASNAYTYATSAERSSVNASASAQSASGYASNAQTSANTASAKAQDASGYAQTASQKATESAQSASQALTYKTDAESAKTASQTAQGLAESARDTAVSAKDDAESARDDAETARDEAQSAVASISGALADKAPVITDTASGSIASFSDGADDLPLKSLVVDINPIQDLSHGDPSPENICPISGWTQVGVEQSGKNLFNKSAITADSWIVVNSTDIATAVGYFVSDYIPVIKNVSIVCTARGASRCCYYDKQKNPIAYFSWSSGKVTPLYDGYIRVTDINGNLDALQIEYGSTATPYEPYTGRSITIDLGQTVYGGHLDVLSGVLTVDRAMVDLGTLSYARTQSSGGVYHFTGYPTGIYIGVIGYESLLCSSYKAIPCINASTATESNFPNNCICQSVSGYSVRIRDDDYTDAATFKSAMNGVQLVYPLATPIEIQLSANQINSLYGVNNIWADSGDTEVEYRADTKAWVQRKIAEAIASLT